MISHWWWVFISTSAENLWKQNQWWGVKEPRNVSTSEVTVLMQHFQGHGLSKWCLKFRCLFSQSVVILILWSIHRPHTCMYLCQDFYGDVYGPTVSNFPLLFWTEVLLEIFPMQNMMHFTVWQQLNISPLRGNISLQRHTQLPVIEWSSML